MTNPHISASAGSPRTKMLRALLLAPVAIGVLAGAVVTGTGIGAAAPADATGSASLGADAPQSVPGYTWTLTNGTDQPIWGEMYKNREIGGSSIYAPQDQPIPEFGGRGPNVRSAYQPAVPDGKRETIFGRLCYRGNYYNLRQGTPSTAHAYTFDGAHLTSEQGDIELIRAGDC